MWSTVKSQGVKDNSVYGNDTWEYCCQHVDLCYIRYGKHLPRKEAGTQNWLNSIVWRKTWKKITSYNWNKWSAYYLTLQYSVSTERTFLNCSNMLLCMRFKTITVGSFAEIQKNSNWLSVPQNSIVKSHYCVFYQRHFGLRPSLFPQSRSLILFCREIYQWSVINCANIIDSWLRLISRNMYQWTVMHTLLAILTVTPTEMWPVNWLFT